MSWHLLQNRSVFTVIPASFLIIVTASGKNIATGTSADRRARMQAKSDGWTKILAISKGPRTYNVYRNGVGLTLVTGRARPERVRYKMTAIEKVHKNKMILRQTPLFRRTLC